MASRQRQEQTRERAANGIADIHQSPAPPRRSGVYRQAWFPLHPHLELSAIVSILYHLNAGFMSKLAVKLVNKKWRREGLAEKKWIDFDACAVDNVLGSAAVVA